LQVYFAILVIFKIYLFW